MNITDPLEEMNRLVENRPCLMNFQDEIHRRLDKAGNAENRIAVLGVMIEANLYELRKELSCLLVLTD